MREVHDAHRQRDRLAPDVLGEALAVPALEREGERLADARAEVEPRDEHVRHLAPGREVVDGPLVRRLLQHPHDLVALLVGAAGRGVREHVAHHLGGVAAVVHERLRADPDLVAEQRRDLVGVPGAADVAQQRDPVGVLAHLLVEPRRLAHPRREQARAQLGLERLAEGVVLRQRKRCDEFAQAKRCLRNGESSRCFRRAATLRSASVRALPQIETEGAALNL